MTSRRKLPRGTVPEDGAPKRVGEVTPGRVGMGRVAPSHLDTGNPPEPAPAGASVPCSVCRPPSLTRSGCAPSHGSTGAALARGPKPTCASPFRCPGSAPRARGRPRRTRRRLRGRTGPRGCMFLHPPTTPGPKTVTNCMLRCDPSHADRGGISARKRGCRRPIAAGCRSIVAAWALLRGRRVPKVSSVRRSTLTREPGSLERVAQVVRVRRVAGGFRPRHRRGSTSACS